MGLHGPAALNLARRAPRNMDFGQLQETFLVVAVTTILVIRTQLWLTNYPQLGGHGLHIAHLLWGGMFMVIAIGILVTFLGPRRAGSPPSSAASASASSSTSSGSSSPPTTTTSSSLRPR